MLIKIFFKEDYGISINTDILLSKKKKIWAEHCVGFAATNILKRLYLHIHSTTLKNAHDKANSTWLLRKWAAGRQG